MPQWVRHSASVVHEVRLSVSVGQACGSSCVMTINDQPPLKEWADFLTEVTVTQLARKLTQNVLRTKRVKKNSLSLPLMTMSPPTTALGSTTKTSTPHLRSTQPSRQSTELGQKSPEDKMSQSRRRALVAIAEKTIKALEEIAKQKRNCSENVQDDEEREKEELRVRAAQWWLDFGITRKVTKRSSLSVTRSVALR